MNPPQNLIIPPLNAGSRAKITWSSVPQAEGYILERKFDAVFGETALLDWQSLINQCNLVDNLSQKLLTWNGLSLLSYDAIVYNGALTQFSDNILPNIQTAIYRVKSYTADSSSGFKTSALTSVIPLRPPVISGENDSLGGKQKGFEIAFNVFSPDPEVAIDIKILLDGALIWSRNAISQNIDYKTEISSAMIDEMPDETSHLIKIVALDNRGLVSERIYTFKVLKSVLQNITYYILRDDVIIAKIKDTDSWADYLSCGKHCYRIRGVDHKDNFVDSNEISTTIAIEHATLALAQKPNAMVELKVKRGQSPGKLVEHINEKQPIFFEGRTHPVFFESKASLEKITLDYSCTNLADFNTLQSFWESGKTLLYRDSFDREYYCLLSSFPASYIYHKREREAFSAAIDFTLSLTVVDYSQEIDYD